jgi:hypothetical protein
VKPRYLLALLPLLLAGCLAVGPAGPYTNGQVVDISILQFPAGATVWLSECGPGQSPAPATGCQPSLTGQPRVRLDSRGSGSAHYPVRSKVNGIACAGYCTIVATDGKHVQTVPISFMRQGSLAIASGFATMPLDVYIGRFLYQTTLSNPVPLVVVNPDTYKVDFHRNSDLPGSKPPATTTVKLPSGKGVSVVAFPETANRIGVVQTPVPAPPAATQLRVTFVNEIQFTVTPKLDNVTGPALAPGRSFTLTVAPPSNVPNGDDSWEASYPRLTPGGPACGAGNAGGLFTRGHGYVVTIVAQQPGSGGACPYTPQAVIQGGVG